MQPEPPALIFADENGQIMEFEPLAMVGRSGDYYQPIDNHEVMTLPPGSQLYVLEGRHPVGMDRETGQLMVMDENPYAPGKPAWAVAVFLPAAHTQTYLCAWERRIDARVLPLFAYTAAGWRDGFVTTAVRVDASRRQDPDQFDHAKIKAGTLIWQQEMPQNRLVKHLVHCALGYGCPAAMNLFQGREEGPLPTSPGCNADCLGCISLQDGCDPPSPQDRIKFVPTPEEIAQVALKHIAAVDNPVVSFGQGCEGEPLLAADTIREAIRLIRARTSRGTINLNSNASLPHKIAELADAGLDSLRISMNSPREQTYRAYFRPRYEFTALLESSKEMKRRGKFVSLNLFVFPGLTDAPKEADDLRRFIAEGGVDMIQWRNHNIDPDWYLETLGQNLPSGGGIASLIGSIPIRRGYFNPYLGDERT